jgi:tRNA G18 (ribose-2'-O)-methylase SpoU
VVLADNVDKANNMGGVLRAADAFLAEKVLSNRSEPDFGGAMGAEHWQPVEWNVDLQTAITRYRDGGYVAVALEQRPGATSISQFCFPPRVALAIGSEMFGVSDEIMSLVDHIVYIPQAGLIKSLNVTTATAIALYEYSRQHWIPGFEQPGRHLEPAAKSVRVERADRFVDSPRNQS